MANGFTLVSRRCPDYISLDAIQAKPDTQFYQNCALELANGCLLPINAQADKVVGVYNSLEIPKSVYPGSRPVAHKSSVSEGEKCLYTPQPNDSAEYETEMTGVDALAIMNVAGDSNAVTTTVKVAGSGTNGDYDGGTVFALGEQRNITASTISGDVWTFTVDRAFPRAVTTGDKVTATHLNVGLKNVKMSSSLPCMGISPTKGDETGGYFEITEVRLDHVRPIIAGRFKAA